MITDIHEIQNKLKSFLQNASPLLRVRTETDSNFEVAGSKVVMQGKKKVDGIYFASVVPKPKDIRLYFFPIYTHADAFKISEDLKKCLKGKSCFHFKKLTNELEQEIEEMIKKGAEIYEKDALI
jgi:hypothetical protein